MAQQRDVKNGTGPAKRDTPSRRGEGTRPGGRVEIGGRVRLGGRDRAGGCTRWGVPPRFGGEEGSAAIAVVGLLAALLFTSAAAVGACALLAEKQHVSAAADAAALAAADAASGLVAGIPCERADQAARLNGASLAACRLDGSVVLVCARTEFGGMPISVWARAGPPDDD